MRSLPEYPTTALPDTPVSVISVDEYGSDRPPADQPNASNLASAQNPRYARSHSHASRPQTPPTGARLNFHGPTASGNHSPHRDRDRQHRLHTASRLSAGPDTFESFLNMEEDKDESRGAPSSPDANKSRSDVPVSQDAGSMFSELVDRLVAQPVSKQDSKFASIFLCLYRKFASPAALLCTLIQRFEQNERTIPDQLALMADQLRLLNIMAQWVSEYPGDLAYPQTRKRLVDFITLLERSHFYMFAAKEVSASLETPAEDDDVVWPYRDEDADDANGTDAIFNHSDGSSPSIALGSPAVGEEDGEEEDPIYSMSTTDLSEQPPTAPTNLSNTSLVDKAGTTLGQSFTPLSQEAAQREAQNLELTPRIPFTKVQWRQLMEFPDDDIARELTRIDWIMYNSFRPRDLVRHVSISGPDKDKIKSLQHVNRMIKQFNHVAMLVASMILFRDKPKHRVKALEKFMNVAQVGDIF